jgi:hypothetical protein
MSCENPWIDLSHLECYLRDAINGTLGVEADQRFRHVWKVWNLWRTCAFIRDELRNMGFSEPHLMEMSFDAHFWGDDSGVKRSVRVSNVVAELPGASRRGEIVIVGAHYDSRVGMRGQRAKRPDFHMQPQDRFYDTPGANDNGSGVAALLALAKAFYLDRSHLQRTLRFVAWVNEEYPFYSNHWVDGEERNGERFFAKGMGSYVHAKHCRDQGERVVGVVALDSLGIYADSGGLNLEACSHWEALLAKKFFPDRRDYVAFLSNYPSARLANLFWESYCAAYRDTFGCSSTEDPEKHAIVRWLPLVKSPSDRKRFSFRSLMSGVLSPLETGWSDDWAYWQFDYPAFTVTDTAYYRSPSYHSCDDVPDNNKNVINYGEFSRVVWTLRQAIRKTFLEIR